MSINVSNTRSNSRSNSRSNTATDTTPTHININQPNDKSASLENPQKSSGLLPQYIDLTRWEETGFTWTGTLAPSVFTRLDDIIVEAHKDTPIKVSCELLKQNNVTWLTMSFDGDVWVTCQRCLQPLAIDVSHDASLALLYDESQQSALDDEDEFLLLEEVTVNANDKLTGNGNVNVNGDNQATSQVASRETKRNKNHEDYLSQAQMSKTTHKLLPLAKLVEDELLLDVPLSPKHNDCKMLVDHVGEIEEEEEEESPFAALASLKGKL